MRIIISPAKKMIVDDDFLPLTTPPFLAEAEYLRKTLQKLTPQQLQKLWQCNDKIAEENIQRLQTLDLRKNLTAAIMAYDGIQYKYMAPAVMEEESLAYLQEHLRILSGFYGILRPLDAVVPYRLEMQAKLAVDGKKNLYEFWQRKLADYLFAETDFILNLASKEYSKVIEPYLGENITFISCIFGELKDGKVMEKGTLCKMARGEMVQWLAKNKVTEAEKIKNFDRLDYTFAEKYSTASNFVFIKGGCRC